METMTEGTERWIRRWAIEQVISYAGTIEDTIAQAQALYDFVVKDQTCPCCGKKRL